MTPKRADYASDPNYADVEEITLHKSNVSLSFADNLSLCAR